MRRVENFSCETGDTTAVYAARLSGHSDAELQ